MKFCGDVMIFLVCQLIIVKLNLLIGGGVFLMGLLNLWCFVDKKMKCVVVLELVEEGCEFGGVVVDEFGLYLIIQLYDDDYYDDDLNWDDLDDDVYDVNFLNNFDLVWWVW